MEFGISSLLKSLLPKTFLYEIKRFQTLRKFKGKQLSIGLGTKIDAAQIGFRVYIGQNTLCANSSINDFSYINDNASIRYAKIGKFCSIGPGVKINPGNHPLAMVSTHPVFYANNKPYKCFANEMYFDEFKEVIIGNDVLIGDGALILGGVKIGDGAIIASRAVVSKDIAPYELVAGIPAKLVKHRFDRETIEKLIKSKWWDNDLAWLENNYKAFHDPKNLLSLLNEKE